jgi:hypothetical protein
MRRDVGEMRSNVDEMRSRRKQKVIQVKKQKQMVNGRQSQEQMALWNANSV